jgi:hypothetical protein
MNELIISATEFTPSIKFQPEKHTFEFKGVSRPENVFEFYNPIIEYVKDYESELYKNHVLGGSKLEIHVLFKFSYFNSSSAKMMFMILECLVRIKNMGYHINIDWYYDEGDDQMYDDGQELSEAMDIPFNYHELS